MTAVPEDAAGAGWRRWMVTCRGARFAGDAIAALAATGAAVAATIAITALVRQKPTPGLTPILPLLAAPVVAAGQVWMLGWMTIWQPRRRGRTWRDRAADQRMYTLNPAAFFFGPFRPRVAIAFLGVFFTGWLLGMTAFPAVSDGGPAHSAATCRYPLDNHGSLTCVSRGEYERAGAGEQRFAAGVLLGFFALHTGAALGGRATQDQYRRRPPGDTYVP